MKKIFTLLIVAICAALVMPAQAFDTSNVKFSGFKGNCAKLNTQAKVMEAVEAPEAANKVVKRTWQSGQYIYEATFMNMGVLTDNIQFTMVDPTTGAESFADFEDFPYYCVVMLLTRANRTSVNNKTVQVQCWTSWPAECSLDWVGDTQIDYSLNEIVTPDVLAASKTACKIFKYHGFTGENEVSNFFPSINTATGKMSGWPIWSNQVDVKQIVNNNSDLSFTSEGSNITAFSVEEFDHENEDEIYMPFEFHFSNGTIIDGEYRGGCELVDMYLFDAVYNFRELHIFNGGQSKMADTLDEDIYPYPFGYPENPDWNPVNKYFIVAVEGEGMIWIDVAGQGAVPFDSMLLKVYLTPDQQKNLDNLRWIKGSFWTSADNFYNQRFNCKGATPYQETIPGTDQKVTVFRCNPENGIFIPKGYDDSYDWVAEDGFETVWGKYERDFCAPSYFATNTPEGFKLDALDLPGNTYKAAYKGKVIYHPNPANMRETQELESLVGDFDPEQSGVAAIGADDTFVVSTFGNDINVESNEDAVVVVYNLAGAAVAKANVAAGNAATFTVGNGVYVVKVGNAAKKVVL